MKLILSAEDLGKLLDAQNLTDDVKKTIAGELVRLAGSDELIQGLKQIADRYLQKVLEDAVQVKELWRTEGGVLKGWAAETVKDIVKAALKEEMAADSTLRKYVMEQIEKRIQPMIASAVKEAVEKERAWSEEDRIKAIVRQTIYEMITRK